MNKVNITGPLWTMFIGMIFSIVFCATFIDYLLNPGLMYRDEQVLYVRIYLLKNLYILIVFYALFYASQNMRKLPLKFYFVVTGWLFISQIIVYAGRFDGIEVWRYVLWTELFIFVLGYLFFAESSPEHMLKVINITYIMTILILSFFTYYVYSNDLLVNRMLFGFNFSPQLEYNILQSTEMSNVFAQVLIIGYTLLFTRYNNITYSKRLLLYTSLGFLVLIVSYLFSAGTLIALFLIVALSLQSRKLILLSIVGGLGLMIIDYYEYEIIGFLSEWYMFKVSDERRVYTYTRLIEIIDDNFISGVGIGISKDIIGFYPHQNLLGTFAEGGIALFLFYVVLMMFPLFVYIRLRKTAMQIEHRIIFLMAIYSLLYWHLKGLAQDTWYQPEVYLWTGMLCAVYDKYSIRQYAKKIMAIPVHMRNARNGWTDNDNS